MFHIEKELLPEDAVALKDAAIDRRVDKVVEILKRAGTAKRARALAEAAERIPNRLFTSYGLSYSVLVEGSKETIFVYRVGTYSTHPVAGITFTL